MNFKEFTEKIVELLQQETSDACTVKVSEILKNNNIRMTGVIIRDKDNGIIPVIYLENFYTQYQAGVPMEVLTEEIMEYYQEHRCNLDMNFYKYFSCVKDKIFCKVVNYEQNTKQLQNMPHFRWHDLAITFYYDMHDTFNMQSSIPVLNNHLDMWKQSADDLYHIAQYNMVENIPEILKPVQEVLNESAEIEVKNKFVPLYLLTNAQKRFGASVMLYTKKLKGLADKLGSDLLILPSSIHEGATRFVI